MKGLLPFVSASFLFIVPIALQAAALRVCANPDNLPFSHDGTPRRVCTSTSADGLAKRVGMSVEYVWQGDYSSK